MKRPSFQFYPGDWQHDASLRSCSVAARGLWIEMMCVMHQAQPYGYLVLNGKSVGPAQLGRMVGATAGEIAKWTAELEGAGVFSKDEAGIFSRRMVRDERLRTVRGEAGKLGGNPKLLANKVKQNSGGKDNQSPTPSSSSSSSKSKTKAQRFAPPPWIPEATWQEFEEHRGKLRKPMTDMARALIVGKLEKFKAQGADPVAIIEQSIRSGWQDVFELKASGNVAGQSGEAWWSSEAGILTKGKELGMQPRGNESWQAFKGRINESLRAKAA